MSEPDGSMTEERKLRGYAEAIGWFMEHPEAMEDDAILRQLVNWIKRKVDRAAGEVPGGCDEPSKEYTD